MIIKRSFQCLECRQFNDVYAYSGYKLAGHIINCTCGSQLKCVDNHRAIKSNKKVK